LGFLGGVFYWKGELNEALKYNMEALALAEKNGYESLIVWNMSLIGSIYSMKGDLNKGIEYLERCLALSEKVGYTMIIDGAHISLLLSYLKNNSREKAQQHLIHLKELAEQEESRLFSDSYLYAKALMLKTSGRMRNRAKAEDIFNKIVKGDISLGDIRIRALISLSEMYIEELSIYNNPEVLDEINPLILDLLKVSETQNSKSYLAEGKLLQAKLALIQMEFDAAKTLLTQAQQIAEENGLNLLAQNISSEHDILLKKIDEWDKLKKKDAPMAERIELASFDKVIDRLQGKRAIEPPELKDEEPILLLIMDNSGVTYFNHPFVSNWDHSDLFSSFMSAFNTFIDEIFSKSIDRIRVGENTILINPVESFLACYVIKGQSYSALQKLTRFTEAIKENSEIWQTLKKSVKTSEMLELNKQPALKTVINEIFNQ